MNYGDLNPLLSHTLSGFLSVLGVGLNFVFFIILTEAVFNVVSIVFETVEYLQLANR